MHWSTLLQLDFTDDVTQTWALYLLTYAPAPDIMFRVLPLCLQSRAGSPQFEVVPNGSSTRGIGVGVLQPPPPPTEGVIAVAAVPSVATMMPVSAIAGAGRPSPKQGGRTECRYGTGCKRPDCSFSHPLGEAMALFEGRGETFFVFLCSTAHSPCKVARCHNRSNRGRPRLTPPACLIRLCDC